jgi:prolyl-tRNA synthetase
MATKSEIELMGMFPGYLSPLGLKKKMIVVVDDTVVNSRNIAYGANKEGRYLINVNFGRDYETQLIGDISKISAHDKCIQCGSELEEKKVIELGNIFKLGDFYSKAMGLIYQSESGKKHFPHMGSYGIGIGRLMASIVEGNLDEDGIVWPYIIAPFKVFLMGIGKSEAVYKAIEEIYKQRPEIFLYDDRSESPGVKFKDADLIGIPLRVVVSQKNLVNNQVEISERKSRKSWNVSIDDLLKEIENYERKHI